MKPTHELEEEHQAILSMIRVLARISNRLEAGEAVDAAHIERAVDFIRGFADGCHHAKEEAALFPAMEKAGIPREGGPLAAMLDEHAEEGSFVNALAESAAEAASGGEGAARRFAENVRSYGALLSQHIFKENSVLYPMADARLSAADQDKLARRFAEVEEEVVGRDRYRRYLELLESMKKAYGL